MFRFRKLNPAIRFVIGGSVIVLGVICGVRCMVNATGDTAYLMGLYAAEHPEARLEEV